MTHVLRLAGLACCLWAAACGSEPMAPAAARAPASAGPKALPSAPDPKPTSGSTAQPEPGSPADADDDAPAVAAEEERQPGPATAEDTARADSVSLGYPNDGELRDGARIPLAQASFRFNPNRESSARFATREVLEAIERAAREVHAALPGGRLTVNDLSLEGGGPIAHHGSHRNGRDADLLFYLLDDDGQPIESVGAPLDPEGYGHDYKDLTRAEDDVRVHLDAPRTWRFVQALMSDPRAQVQRIFVVEHVRAMLLEEARKKGAPAALVQRFADVSCQPGFPHDDHLHVRWFCDPLDIPLGCEDMEPIYPWHHAWLAEQGAAAVPAKRDRKPPKAKVYGHAEARRRAGPLHPDVVAFLERRKAWLPAPHPGRRWCK